MTTTMRGRHLTAPMVPQLVPVFGSIFVVLFMLAQGAGCLALDMKRGFAWMAPAFVIGFVAGYLGESVWGTDGYDWTRHRLLGGACFSAIALSVQILRGKL